MNNGKTNEVFYSKTNREPIIIHPGEQLFLDTMERVNLSMYLVNPDLWNAQQAAEEIFGTKDEASVLLNAWLIDKVGDQIQLTIFAKAYKEVYGERMKVYVSAPASMAPVWEANPHIDGFFSQSPQDLAVAQKKFDITVDLNTLETKWRNRLADLQTGHRHRSEICLEATGLTLVNNTPVYVVTPEERAWAKSVLADEKRPLIAVQTRASCTSRTPRQMPKIIAALQANYTVVQLDREMPDPLGQFTLRQAAALMNECDVVVALDSGLLHLAGALKKRIVALYGHTDGWIFTEDYEKAVVLQGRCPEDIGPCWWTLACLPGDSYAAKKDAGFTACLDRITPEHVVGQVEFQLTKPKKILACMLTYNLLDMTKKAVASLRTFHNLDLLVVDNASTDGTMEWLQQQGIAHASGRMSVPAACNVGLKKFLAGDYEAFLLLNNDIVGRYDAIDKLAACLAKSAAWAVTATVMANIPPWRVDWVSLPNRGWREMIDITPGAYSFTLFSRKCVEKVGLFDERFGPRYIEDNDYTLRIRLAGGVFAESMEAGYFHALGAVLNSNELERRNGDENWKRNCAVFTEKWGFTPHEHQALWKVTNRQKIQAPAGAVGPSYGVRCDMNGFGDYVFLSVIAKAAKTKHPGSRVYYCVPEKFFPVFYGNPYIDQLLPLDGACPADIMVDCTELDFKQESQEVAATGAIHSNRAAIFLRAMGLPVDDIHPRMFIGVDETEWAEAEWSRLGYGKRVAVAQKASNMIMTWPHVNQFMDLARTFSAAPINLVVLDAQVSGKFRYTFRQAAALISVANVYVGPNTGFSNVAGALDIPAVTIFGHRNGKVMAEMFPAMIPVQGDCPVAPGTHFCDYRVPCIPGASYRAKENTRHPACICSITPQAVMLEVQKVLEYGDIALSEAEEALREGPRGLTLLKQYKRDPAFLCNPRGYRLRDAFEFIIRTKGSLSVLVTRDNASYVTKAGVIGGRGDVLMASVIAKALKIHYGDKVTVGMKVMSGGETLIENNPYIDKVFTDASEAAAMAADIELSVNDFEFGMETRELAKGGLISKSRTAIYLEMLGLPLVNRTPIFTIRDEERVWASQELKAKGFDPAKPIIGVQAGASNASRTWPRTDELLAELKKSGYQPFLLDEMRDELFVYNFRQIAALMDQMFLVIAPNSFFFHLAGAIGKRCIALFGSVEPEMWVADYAKCLALAGTCPAKPKKCWWDLSCLPGAERNQRELSRSPECLASITVKDVLQKVEEHRAAKKIGIMLLTYDCLEFTKRTVASLRSFHDYQLVVIDNASTDGTVEWLTEQKIPFVSEKLTVTQAQNRGLTTLMGMAAFDYFMILNNDVVLSPTYLDTLVETLSRHPNSAATGKVIDVREAGIDGFIDKTQPEEAEMAEMVAGDFSAILISREAIFRVGKLDEQFSPRYQEDEDFILRLRLSGGTVMRTMRTTFFHDLGTTQANHPDEKQLHDENWERNTAKFAAKWGFDPYTQRELYKDLEKIKALTPDWEAKVSIPFDMSGPLYARYTPIFTTVNAGQDGGAAK